MRNWIRITLRRCLPVAALLLFGAAAPACNRKGLPAGDPGSAGTGGGIVGLGGNGGQGVTGVGGAAGIAAACSGASDERLVIADQRILRLTDRETVNTIRYLFGDTEATALVNDGIIGDSDLERRFPPLQGNTDIDSPTFAGLEQVAQHVGAYVLANFATVTACPAVTDACATTYLDKLAGRAYRRQLTQDEQTRFSALYTRLRNPQTVNGYLVTFTVEEATSYAVEALLTSPQMLWRWRLAIPRWPQRLPRGCRSPTRSSRRTWRFF